MIKIYANRLSGTEPEVIQTIQTQSVLDWLWADGLPKDVSIWKLPISVFVDGEQVMPFDWGNKVFTPSSLVEIYREPKGIETAIIAGTLALAAKVVLSALTPKLPTTSSATNATGDALDEASAKGNKVKVNDVIPELAGYNRRYGDYLTLTRRYFTAPREQWIEMLLCVGKGEYDIPLTKVKVGETPLLSLGADASFNIYGPGADLSSEPAHLVWYTSPEVAATSTGASGLELTVSTDLTTAATSTTFTFVDDTISGTFPDDWVDGLIIQVAAPYPYTVADGTGDASRDVINGDIAQLGFTAGDTIEIQGDNAGQYIVHSVTSSTLQLDYSDGTPATGLALGSLTMAIAFRGMRFRILVAGTTLLEVERIKSDGSEDTGWPGWSARTSSQGQVRLDPSNLEGGYRGPFPACPEGEVCTQLEWDIFFPSGLAGLGREGQKYTIGGYYSFEYRDMATLGPWVAAQYVHSNNVTDAVGYTQRITLPYAMRPEVRVKKVFVDQGGNSSTEYVDTMMWYGLKSLIPSLVRSSFPGVTTLAAYIRGGDRIASQTEKLVNCICTRKLPVLDGTGNWGPSSPTRQISAWIGHVARSIGYEDTDLDLVELQRLENIWTARGDNYDRILDSSETVKASMIEALAAGFAELTLDNGLITPVIDMPRTDFNHLYPAEVMTEVLSTDFTATTPDDYDGVDVEYRDQDSWTQLTVQCRLPGDAGTRVDKVTLEGVIDRDKAYQIGMRRRLQYKYQRKTYSFSCEMDALNSRYGDYVALGDSVTGFGQSSELTNIEADGTGWVLASSEPLDWSAGGVFLVAIRRKDGSLSGPYDATRVDDYRLRISELDFTPDLSGVWEPPFLQFGPEAVWCYPAIIQEVAPSGVTGCKVTAVNYDPRIYAYDNTPADN